MAVEAELKLGMPEGLGERVLSHSLVTALAQGGPRTRQLSNTYYDTPELTLLASGVGLRLRRRITSYNVCYTKLLRGAQLVQKVHELRIHLGHLVVAEVAEHVVDLRETILHVDALGPVDGGDALAGVEVMEGEAALLHVAQVRKCRRHGEGSGGGDGRNNFV